MNDDISLFAELKGSGYSACLMTTFSMNFAFFEDVLLRRMIASGIGHHVVLVDKGMCLMAMQSDHPKRAGSHYVLAPMKSPSAFHPKIIMLLGEKKGLLAVGSNNITLSGYGQNLEITNGFRFNLDGNTEHLHIFRAAFGAIKDWVGAYGQALPESVLVAVERTTNLCPWLKGDLEDGAAHSSNTHFFYSSGTQESLWEQLTPLLPSNIHTGIGISAFFDNQLRFLNNVVSLGAQPLHLGIQPNCVSAPPSLLNTEKVNVVDVDALLQQNGSKRYSHAKALYLAGDSDLFVSGSANFSYPGWMAKGAEQNAEAVIAVTGTNARLVAEQLGMTELVNAPAVKSIISRESAEAIDARDQVELLVVEANDSCIEIPISEVWPEGHALACIDHFDRFEPIAAVKKQATWMIELKDFAPYAGKVIFVIDGDEVLAKVIVILTNEIYQRCGSVKERAIAQAFQSLHGDSPNLRFIFNHLDKITRDSAEKNSAELRKKKPSTGKTGTDIERTTLIESMVQSDIPIGQSGRHRIGTSDVQLTLDMLGYVIGRDKTLDNNEAFGEDLLGRNEEELIGEEFTPEIETPIPTLSAADAEKNAQERDRFKKRFKSLLDSEKKRFEGLKVASSDSLEHHVTICLTFAALAHEMTYGQAKGDYIGDDFFTTLSDFVFCQLLNDKDPITRAPHLNSQSLYDSEEWGKFIAYCVWLAYKSGVALRTRLPISASKADQNLVKWQNACWIYLAQRLAADDLVSDLATELFLVGDAYSLVWLEHMLAVGERLIVNKLSDLPQGLSLALSPFGGFDGYRVVDVVEGDMVYMVSINLSKPANGFKIEKLQLA